MNNVESWVQHPIHKQLFSSSKGQVKRVFSSGEKIMKQKSMTNGYYIMAVTIDGGDTWRA